MSQHHNQGSVVLRTITVLFALAAGFVGGCYVGFRQAPVDASSPGLLRDDTAVLNRLNATTRLLSDLDRKSVV